MIIHLKSGKLIYTKMKHVELTDLMQDDSYDFIVVPDESNELRLFNIRKSEIEMLEVY
jgi:hypothetical protein